EGKFSMQFCLASAVVDGRVSIPQFEEDRVRRPEVEALQRRVTFEVDPELARDDPESHRAEVWVRLKGGREVRRLETRPKGHVERPIPAGELREKFMECALASLSKDQAEAAWEGWWGLEGARDIGPLTRLLQPA
ncbi:MAG: MmgE/PrpD family protein, partial [Candidatus Tectomicrobia bacterium]|nr:MmgE/PrpD family protein [Candidatus Tectomicrobia bacterium]